VVLLLADLGADAYFLVLRWDNPPATAYMLENNVHGYDYVAIAHMSSAVIGVTVAHEDAELPTRFTGLNWGQFVDRAQAYSDGLDDPYGSPIPEQLAKNLLLYPGQNWVRKGADAVLAEQLAHIVPKQRILELYLNVAQFGPKLYGICDASWYYFEKPPGRLTLDESTELMGVLPGPIHAHRKPHGLGIDTNPRTVDGLYERGKINGARRYVHRELDSGGGAAAIANAMNAGGLESSEAGSGASCTQKPDTVRSLQMDVK
jgi:monofunctional biosynthetic peptidoglycan transglycosylase